MATSSRLGQLRYKIRYDTTIGKLHVTVVECKDLPKADILGKVDPYVKVFLMPGNHADLKTKVIKKNFNPVFNDEFSFVIDVENAQKKTIVFQVFDKDIVGKDDAVGEVQVPLWLVDMFIVTDKNENLEKPTTDKNKKPVLKLKRPNATTRSSSIASLSSTSSSVRDTTFDTSGGHRHSTAGSFQSSSGGQGFHNSSSGGQGFHHSSTVGGQNFHDSSTVDGQGIHNSSSGGQGFHNSSSGGQGFHNSSIGGQGFHNSSTVGGQGLHSSSTAGGQGTHVGGQEIHMSTVGGGQGFHSSTSGQSFHRSSSSSGQGFHGSESGEVTQTMSLHMLNERLERYIRGIHLTPERNVTSVSVVTTSDSVGQDIESLPEYQQWEDIIKQYEEEERELAKLKAEIAEIEINNSYIRDGNSQLDEFIHTVEGQIRDKLGEISILEEKLRKIQMERERLERIKIEREQMLADLVSKVDIVSTGWGVAQTQISMNAVCAGINDEQRRFIESVNGKDWEEETTSTSFDKNKIRDDIKADYDRRLHEELEKLRAEYNEFYHQVNISTKDIYKDKIAKLKAKLGELTPDEQRDVEEILKKLRDAKEKIKQLEILKLELTQKERALGEGLEEDEAYWKAKIEEKNKEIAFLEGELSFLSYRYEEISKSGGVYSAAEVKRYSELIQSTHVMGVTEHAKLFLEGVERLRKDSSSSSSSSSSEGELVDNYDISSPATKH